MAEDEEKNRKIRRHLGRNRKMKEDNVKWKKIKRDE